MNECPQRNELERSFDVKEDFDAKLSAHIESCDDCRAHLAFLKATRASLKSHAESLPNAVATPEGFDAALRDAIEKRPARPRAAWALLSLTAAAFLVAISLLTIMTPAPPAAQAGSEIQSTWTGIEGGSTETYHADDGTAMVWINVPEGDMW